jgi:biopolymer transport protein ExbB/TolQ
MSFTRVRKLGFRKPQQQSEFLEQLMGLLHAGKFEEAQTLCDGDNRALPQLCHLIVVNREIGTEPLKQLVLEVLQRDILADLDRITGWVATTIKSGPLLGLFGTVLGMMAAFGRIGTGEKVETSSIAAEISIALICTAMGLATAIPFNYLLANINGRIGRVRDSLSAGLVRVLDFFQEPPVRRERFHG